MAGSLKPSTAGEEANYIHLGGATSVGAYNKNGSGLFNGAITQTNSQGTGSLYEGRYNNQMGGGTSAKAYVLLDIKEKCNIYGHLALGTTPPEKAYNHTASATGQLLILQHDGTDYAIDVTSKHWVARKFTYSSSTAISNGLTFQEFLDTELIDGYWQKMITDLPPGKYKFLQNDVGTVRQDNEWYLEKVIIPPPLTMEDKILQTIYNNKMFKHLITYTIENEN